MSSSLVSKFFSFKNSMGHQNWRISSTSPSLRHKFSSVSFHSRFNNISNNLEKFHHQDLIIPKHVALIMDGNRRWAKAKGLPIREGYKRVTARLKELCDTSSELGIQVLTAGAFSTENWKRPKEEVDIIMQVLEELFEGSMRYGVRVSMIGGRSNLPMTLQKCITLTEETTKGNSSGVHLVIAVNYGGRYDILEATKSISSKVKEGLLQLEDIDTNVFEQELATKCLKFSNPDLIIRTGGEQRISNFVLWQLAYSEFYFTKTPFPDFGKKDFQEALLSFQQRHRNFGGHNIKENAT